MMLKLLRMLASLVVPRKYKMEPTEGIPGAFRAGYRDTGGKE
jgi:hypothetical protein